MTGANYMGGKRNAARARTKDSTGRLQKRHFGQQRLAAALCNAREERENPRRMTLESALHEISIARAQRDPKITRSVPSTAHISTSHNPSFAYEASLDIQKCRKPSSKILRALDFSDPLSYHDAVERILSIPLSEMIGIPMRGKSPLAQDEDSNDSDKEHVSTYDDTESNVQVRETPSDIRSEISRFSNTASYSFSLDADDSLQNYEGGYHGDYLSEEKLQRSPDQRSDTLPWHVEVDDLQGGFVNDSGYADMDVPETGILGGSILTPDLLGPQQFSPPSNSFPFSFCSSSQGTEECILDMDTSPPSSPGSFMCSMPFDASQAPMSHYENSPSHYPSLQQSPSRSASLPNSSSPSDSLEFFGLDNFIKSNNHQYHLSALASSAEFRSMTQLLHPTEVSASCGRSFQYPYPAIQTEHVDAYSSSTINSLYESPPFGGADIEDPGLPLDILNDPDPWATIGKILNLETVRESDNSDIHYTHGRDGVGYVRPHLDETYQRCIPPTRSKINPPRSIQGECEDEPHASMNDEVKEHSGKNSDLGDFVRYQSQHIEDSHLEERPSPDDSTDSSLVDDTNSTEQKKSHCALTMVESQMQKEPPCLTTALPQKVSPLIVRRGLNEDEMCEGPCLFVDSDGEND